MKTYSGKKFRKAQAALAVAIFVLPTYCFSQGLKFDLLDGSDCRLFSDSTKRGLTVNRDSICLLPTPNSLRTYHEIDNDNRLMTSQSYYLSPSELNRNGQYRVFGLSDAALSRSVFTGRSDWEATKKASLGKSAAGGTGKGFLNVDIPVKFPKMISSLVGEGGPGLSVTGNYKVIFKVDKNYTTGIANIGTNRQGTPGFQTQQEYNMYITGNVGSKLFVNMKTDKRANVYNQRLDLADRIQIRYKGDEEDLVQSIEAGNTTLSLGGTRYAGFSQSVQGLFGLKAQGKLGGLNWTTIASQQKGTSQSKSFRAGAEAAKFTIREKDFLRYTYYDLGRKSIAKPDSGNGLPAFVDEFQPGDRIIVLDLFKKVTNLGNTYDFGNYPKGVCYVDPLDSLNPNYSQEFARERFYRIENTDNKEYILSPDSFYVRFNYGLQQGDVIGAYMLIERDSGGVLDTIQIGGYRPYQPDTSIEKDTVEYVLKLIKHGEFDNDKRITFYYEWKNAYDLRARDIDEDGFSVKIYKAPLGQETDLNKLDYQTVSGGRAVKYLQLLGLDQVQNDASGARNPDNRIDLNGTVVDRARGLILFPDRYPFNTNRSFTGNPVDTLNIKVPSIYTDSTRSTETEYFLEVSTKSRRSEFSLGQVNIMEGSEEVRLNGQRLSRGQDYNIDYELGSIHFLNPAVTDPNADVQINYEYTPFLTAEKKNLFGLRTEYAPSEQLRVGSTVLYRNASTIDQKPRIGEEPSQALLLDADFAYTGQSNLITKLVDKLPGVTAAAPSAFQLDGEIARSLPNPNTIGKAFIDDFEGSRDFIGLGVRREIWTLSSIPAGRDIANRGRLAWYVPDGKIYDPRNGGRAVERFKVLEIFPERAGAVPSKDERTDVLELRYFPKQDSGGFVSPGSWGGIMRYLSAGLQDHLETQFIEFWVGLEEGKPVPRLHFDLGKVSEDVNGDGSFQTEDKPPQNNILSEEEDVGLDGVPDPDTSDDNWDRDIDHINGTEKNANDPGRLSRPDTEDLSGNGALEYGSSWDNYFSFEVDLADTDRFGVPGSGHYNDYNLNQDNQPEPRPGESRPIIWRQYRIPIKDSALVRKTGAPNWNSIQYVRMWLDSVPDTSQTRVILATLEMVGNRWKVMAVLGDSARPAAPGEAVRVSVINSQEHPNYQPPPGVSEVLNRVTNLREREQSLVIRYENLQPSHRGQVQRVLLGGAEDYSGYHIMQMWVHGEAAAAANPLLFFFRFSSTSQTDTNQYYEYRLALKPDWNEIKIDFDRMTNLKKVRADSVDTISEGPYFVKGNPSLAAVRWYVMGVENLDSLQAATGEVWSDELLLSGVRRDAGLAGRFHLSTQLSDFGSLNFDWSRVGATFRNLTGGESGTLSYNRAASTNEALSISGSFQAHKLLPRFLSITALPISINWSRTRSTPRLRTGSDIVLTPEFALAERSENLSRGFSVSPSLRKETKNWLWNLTFNRMTGAFSYRYSRSSDPFTRLDESRFYTASMGYDLSPRKTLSFRPFGWLPSFWLLKKAEKSQFSPLPASFNVSGDVSRSQRATVLNDDNRSRSGSYVRDFNGRISSGFRIFPNLSADYNFSTRRDLSNPDNLAFSFSPKKFRLGLEVERSQGFRSNYNPGLFRFAETRLTFSSTYREAGGRATSADGTRQIDASNGYGVNVNFNLSQFVGAGRGPAVSSMEDRIRKAEKEREKEAEGKRKEEGKKGKVMENQPGKNPFPASDSARPPGHPALAGAGRDSLKAAGLDTVGVETRFRQSLELLFPFPVPSLGFVIPRLGTRPAQADSVRNERAAGVSVPSAQARRDSVFRALSGPPPTQPGADSVRKPPPAPTGPGVKVVGEEGKGKEIFLLSGGLNLFRQLAGRIDPVQFTYNRSNSITRRGLFYRPSLAFQFGLTNNLAEEGRSGASDGSRKTDNYTAGTGFNFGSGLRVNARYGKSIARGFTTSGTTRQEGETFPDLTFNVSGLERRIGILKKFLPAGSTLFSNYQKQTATTFDARTGEKNAVTASKNYSPLVSVSSTFSRGLSANFSYRKSIQTSKSRGLGTAFVESETREKGFLFSTRYSFIAPRGIRLPLLRGIRLSSSLNTNLSVQYTRRVTKNPRPGSGQSGISYDVSSLGITPSMTYSFSTQVDGGLSVQWTDQKDNISKRSTKVRSALFSVDLKF